MKIEPDGSLSFGPEDVVGIIRSALTLRTGHESHLNLDPAHITEFYGEGQESWLTVEAHGERLRLPYDIRVDYRNWPDNKPYGIMKCVGDHVFPFQLTSHREKWVKKWKKEGRLKHNQPCPRVVGVSLGEDGVPVYTVQTARYYDQVGTNLTLDADLVNADGEEIEESCTVRDWDVRQSRLHKGQLPPLEQSKLANTIGVAVGITAKKRGGDTAIWKRLRSEENVTVYKGMWHLPLSFALKVEDRFMDGNPHDLGEFIRPDLNQELAEELGIDLCQFGQPKLLAFCRDLGRGGKPQFFFEMTSSVPFEELNKQADNCSDEYVGRGAIANKKHLDEESQVIAPAYSPELAAFIALKSQGA